MSTSPLPSQIAAPGTSLPPVKAPSLSPIQQTTDAGAPLWASSSPIPTQTGSDPGGAQSTSGTRTIAYVNPGINQINVATPSMYTKPVAAHEATHIFQGSRNGDFQRASQSLLPNGEQSPTDYSYGGVKGLNANPLKSIGNYNPEQQASMVQDLTQAQANLKPNMNPARLQQWDNTKNALERPIRQLIAIPPPDTSLTGRADNWLANNFNLSNVAGHDLRGPLARIKGQFSAPQMPQEPSYPAEAPSAALGYANRSKLVR